MSSYRASLAAGLAAGSLAAAGQDAPREPLPAFAAEAVVVTGTRVERRGFDVPLSVDSVGRDRIVEQQLRVNVAESLGGVPGLVANNRQNYAQDLQLSIRGFGARSTFGVRGVKLVQDGIPLTMPDGQGQAANFALDTARSIEVLRGPFAALYGNASGGVINLFTADGPARPTASSSGAAGSYGTWRANAGFGGEWGAVNAIGDLSRFATDGYREHGAARRDLFNAKVRVELDERSSLTLVANAIDQPDSQDPLGLTAAQVAQNPRQAGTGALLFDTRKSVRQGQLGLAYELYPSAADTVRVAAYGGGRDVLQFLAFTGAAPTSSGGVVDLDREFAGGSVQWRRRTELAGAPFTFSLGLDYDWMGERRRGFVNEFGVPGALRRDEDDTVYSFDQWALAEWDFAPRWRLSAGVRNVRVPFEVADRFVTAANPDDSGRATFSATTPVAGLLYRLGEQVHLYGALGRGFETPTFAEIAYRPDRRPGVNFELAASRSTSAEAGVKARLDERVRVNAALFAIDTKDDIVAAASAGGRTTFTNAPRTTRAGAELAVEAALPAGFRATLAYTYLRARFDDYTTLAGADLSGRRLPGVPGQWLYAAIGWEHAPLGFATTLDLRAVSKVYANDANTASAAGYGVVGWRAGFTQQVGRWRFAEFVRIDNLGDKGYVGSVIVNEANGRFYEPSPARNWLVGLSAAYAF